MVFEKLGKSLSDVMDIAGVFNEKQVVNFARQIFTSLRFFRKIGLTHADLKPENILLATDETDSTKIVIIDMGLATFDEEVHMQIICTPEYRPPEVLLGLSWSHSVDYWSVG